jgi:hypothetical protein
MIHFDFTPSDLAIGAQAFLFAWFFTMPSWWADLLAIGYESLLLKSKPGLFVRRLLDLLYEVLTCHKCLTFWSIWCLTLNPFAALAGAFLASVMSERPLK